MVADVAATPQNRVDATPQIPGNAVFANVSFGSDIKRSSNKVSVAVRGDEYDLHVTDSVVYTPCYLKTIKLRKSDVQQNEIGVSTPRLCALLPVRLQLRQRSVSRHCLAGDVLISP